MCNVWIEYEDILCVDIEMNNVMLIPSWIP